LISTLVVHEARALFISDRVEEPVDVGRCDQWQVDRKNYDKILANAIEGGTDGCSRARTGRLLAEPPNITRRFVTRSDNYDGAGLRDGGQRAIEKGSAVYLDRRFVTAP
jgi:hypothetical protein